MPYKRKINVEKAVELYRSGMGLERIAKHFGCTPSPVFRALKGLVEMRPHTARKIDPEAAELMYRQGMSTPKIALLLGASHPCVQAALRRRGVALRSISEARNVLAKSRRINAYGYATIRIGPRAYRLEHRIIAERVLRRPLRRHEYVHHINSDRADNRPCNLLICTVSYHSALHARMRKHPYWSQFNGR